MIPITKRLQRAEEALQKNGFRLIEGKWSSPEDGALQRGAYAAGRAAAVAELQPAYSAMQERAEKAEALLVLPGCLADRLYEAIEIARERAQHAGSVERRKKWEATKADLQAALARAEPEDTLRAAPTACGACLGSGWVVRDADIGTEQECPSCDGSGNSAP